MADRYDLEALNARPTKEANPAEQELLQLLGTFGWNVRSGCVRVFTINDVPHVALDVTSGTVIITSYCGAFVPIYHTDPTGFSRILVGLGPRLTPQEFEKAIAW